MLILFAGAMIPAYGGFISLSSKSGTDEAKAKTFSPLPNKALVYAFRANAFKGKQTVAKLIVNDKVVAENANNQFSVVVMDAGAYELGCASGHDGNLAVSLIHNKKKEPLPLTVEAGQIYYVQQVFKPMGGFTLKAVTTDEAQPVIEKATLDAIEERDFCRLRPGAGKHEHFVDDLRQVVNLDVKRDFAGLDHREVRNVLDERLHSQRVLLHDVQEAHVVLRIVDRPVEEGLDVRKHRRQGRSQFVREIREEVASDSFEPLELCDIEEHAGRSGLRRLETARSDRIHVQRKDPAVAPPYFDAALLGDARLEH